MFVPVNVPDSVYHLPLTTYVPVVSGDAVLNVVATEPKSVVPEW